VASLEIGIIGLPNVGKTTVFNALTRAGAAVTAYAATSSSANVGVAAVPDARLDRLAVASLSSRFSVQLLLSSSASRRRIARRRD